MINKAKSNLTKAQSQLTSNIGEEKRQHLKDATKQFHKELTTYKKSLADENNLTKKAMLVSKEEHKLMAKLRRAEQDYSNDVDLYLKENLKPDEYKKVAPTILYQAQSGKKISKNSILKVLKSEGKLAKSITAKFGLSDEQKREQVILERDKGIDKANAKQLAVDRNEMEAGTLIRNTLEELRTGGFLDYDDIRYDSTIVKIIESGKPLTERDIREAIARIPGGTAYLE